jgi:hypothetical protein
MFYTELNEGQIKQYIDAEQARGAFLALERRARDYRGSMCWKTVKGRDYLYREQDRRGKSLGPRSQETEDIISTFSSTKKTVEANLATAVDSIRVHARINAALRVGRTPNLVIDTLEAIRKAGLQDHFLVIGTNALYAYETQAGVRFDSNITATTDVDLLWDSRKHITLAADCDEQFLRGGLLGLLKRIDSSFALVKGDEYRAVNAKGYMVDLIKRRPKSLFDDQEKQQLVRNDDDFWAAKIVNMDWLLSSPRYRQTIVGINGGMAEMTTVDPRAFVIYKKWLSEKEDRDPMKKPRDLMQAKAVFELLQARLPHLGFDKMHVFPERLRDISGLSE